MNKFEHAYLKLAEDILDYGITRPSRAGGTTGVFGAILRIEDLRDSRFPILTTRQMHLRPVMGELYCFLKGTDKLQDFIDAGCNYWTPNAEAWFNNKGLKREEMTVGPIYGVQWRNWRGLNDRCIDQMQKLVEGITTDPFGRRHVVTAWDPAELHEMCLPPCHILFQCYVEKDHLSMCVYMRSVDICLGLPSDIILYAALLKLIANTTGYRPGDLTFLMGDAHIYVNHIQELRDQINKTPCALPMYTLLTELDNFKPDDLELEEYTFKRGIRYELNI